MPGSEAAAQTAKRIVGSVPFCLLNWTGRTLSDMRIAALPELLPRASAFVGICCSRRAHPDDRFVPLFVISAPLQGDGEPMDEGPEMGSAQRALSTHDWVVVLAAWCMSGHQRSIGPRSLLR